jgi:hypothetical protein
MEGTQRPDREGGQQTTSHTAKPRAREWKYEMKSWMYFVFSWMLITFPISCPENTIHNIGAARPNDAPCTTSSITQDPKPPAPNHEAPLLLSDAALLLPVTPATTSSAFVASGAAAEHGFSKDNSRCFVCHANFQEEPLAGWHAKAGVGCETCHGASDAHCADESNLTAPDMIFAKEEVGDACLTCHAVGRPEIGKHFAAGKCEKNDCMRCHGAHKMAVRTREWDKKTRQLLRTM